MKTEMAEQHEDKDGFLIRSDMTLRDYFAGQALIAIVNKSLGVERIDAKFMAGVSYEIADAMLEARK